MIAAREARAIAAGAGAEWKIHANAAKFSRLLDERYGPLRPLVDRYPQIERSIRNAQRKYARGELSPLRRGDPPLPPSTAIIVLFMMQRNGIRWEVLGLAATFLLVGLQPWALVVLVSGGHRWRMHRKFRRVAGMAKGTIAPTEPYYSATAGGGGDGAIAPLPSPLRICWPRVGSRAQRLERNCSACVGSVCARCADHTNAMPRRVGGLEQCIRHRFGTAQQQRSAGLGIHK